MAMTQIPIAKKIPTTDIAIDEDYRGIRLLLTQENENARLDYENARYEFQNQTNLTPIKGILSRKGAVGPESQCYRVTFTFNPTIRDFTNIVKYDPADPPIDNFHARGMAEAHKRTQSDFKGSKKQNMLNFSEYLEHAAAGGRTPYLPVISGWQSKVNGNGQRNTTETVFVAFDAIDDHSYYGEIYLPKEPIMQADGQTQTGAIFAFAKSEFGQKHLQNMTVSLEVELGVDAIQAGQSFADRNGRGTKKNKNLVIGLDTNQPLSKMRERVIQGTCFEDRVAKGRDGGVGLTATKNIIDLSTAEQMMLIVVSNDTLKPEHFKDDFMPYFYDHIKDFFVMLDQNFAAKWAEKPGRKEDTFRRLYVHGWPFALKGLAMAYHLAAINEIQPVLGECKKPIDRALNFKEELKKNIAEARINHVDVQSIGTEELKRRVKLIDWERQREHWTKITGIAQRDGSNQMIKLKDERLVVNARAQNQKTIISDVARKIISDSWVDLCQTEDATS